MAWITTPPGATRPARRHADGSPRPGASGRAAALPFLFDAFATVAGWVGNEWAIWDETPVIPAVPPGNLARLIHPSGALADGRGGPPLDLHFPMDGMVLEVGQKGGHLSSIPLEAMGGHGALTWLIDGAPLKRRGRMSASRRGDRAIAWRPLQPGGTEITVLDQVGHSRSARIWIRATGR